MDGREIGRELDDDPAAFLQVDDQQVGGVDRAPGFGRGFLHDLVGVGRLDHRRRPPEGVAGFGDRRGGFLRGPAGAGGEAGGG